MAGKYPPPPGDSEVLGVEGAFSNSLVYYLIYLLVYLVSGVISKISALAKEESDLKEGDRVMALVGGGGYAGIWYIDHSLMVATLFVAQSPESIMPHPLQILLHVLLFCRVLCCPLPSGDESSSGYEYH